ncbi:MAG: hypothetical protein NTW21_34355 [Verrucomicrobia bacterium]|nr:hypothetical protein [Verrucomicrobiota bacterium]
MPTTKLPQWVGLAVLAAMAARGTAEVPVMRDAATHEQLALTLRKAQQEDPMKRLPASKGEDPSQNLPKDLLSQSDIICFGGIATLVPKRAILQIPESCTARLKIEPGARIVGWADFFAANRGWITTIEISRVQAEGKEPIAGDTQEMMAKCRNLVVATYQGGPISMLPLKVPPPDKSPEKSPATPTPTPTETNKP